MSDEYLAVLKASYDYEPQSDDEIAVKENQILLLKERTDEDWWKVKIKGETQEEETLIGLVPSAYVEQAEHISVVKALYDYEASAPGELSIAEDEILLAFEPEDDWLLVQSTKDGGKAGYVPANYVEPHSGEEEDEAPVAQQIIVPPSPSPSPPPASAQYVDPADRVASTKLNADDIKTWSVSEVDKKGKKMKGTLGIGSGAVFFASETSKAAVQKWPTSSITNINVEKSKHVHFDVEGGLSLHFNVGSKDNCEAIVTKLETSKALALQSEEATRAPPPPSLDTLPTRTKASVHFAPESPAIIPSRDSPEPEEAEEEPGEEEVGEMAVALYPFTADGEDELSVVEGEQLMVLEKDGDEWWKCRNAEGAEGVVPASYIELGGQASATPHEEEPVDDEPEEPEPEEDLPDQEALAQEAAEAAEAAERARKEQAAAVERARKEKAATAAAAERTRKEEQDRKEKERKKKEDRAKAAEAERAKRKETNLSHPSPPPATTSSRSSDRPSRNSTDNGLPPADRVRVWHDRSGQFRVEAALLSFKEGKLRLHKTNGVIVEVPSEKMSVEDMRYVEKLLNKKSRPPASTTTNNVSEDDIPLSEHKARVKSMPPKKKGPTIDWFDFFLSAGCDLDDCTRYATSFERDKIDESILPDITDAVMRSLGLREGDIIRVMKAIEKRKPQQPAVDKAKEQIARDEELARQLQARENGDSSKTVSTPPNLFAGANGALKASLRRGRPVPTKTVSGVVDLNTISEVSDKIQIQRTDSPGLLSPVSASATTTPVHNVQPPPRSSSAAPVMSSGFDDDAWTNRPSSTKPIAPTPPPSAGPRAPSAPPVSAPAPVQAAPAPPPAPATSPPSLAKTTEDDVFQQLARLSELRKNTAPPPAPSPMISTPQQQMSHTPSPIPAHSPTPPIGYSSGMGMGNSPAPMGQHLQAQQTGLYGPRGPFAPVPANQGLLQPLIPTQTGFGGFVPTRTGAGGNIGTNTPPSFLQSQPTGFPGAQPQMNMMSQPTGFPGAQQPLMTQATGMPFGGMGMNGGGMNGMSMNGGGMNGMNAVNPFGAGSVMTNPTGFNPGMTPNFNMGGMSPTPPPPVPPLPSSYQSNNNNSNSTNPANVFAQMKSGTFANDDNEPQNANKYDALRPQPTGWGGFQGSSYVGYH